MDASEFKVCEALTITGQTSALTDREKHLIGLAVTTTRGCTACTGGRIEQALNEGIEYETVRAAIDLTAAVNAGVTIRTAIEGAERNQIGAACASEGCVGGTGDETPRG